jgi:hypothetical protein
MFRSLVQELLNLEKHCHWNFNKSKLKFSEIGVELLVLLESS